MSTKTQRGVGYNFWEKIIIQIASVCSYASMKKLTSSVTSIEVLGESFSFPKN